MRNVARLAGLSARVTGGCDLRELFRFGRIGLVAADAQNSRVRQDGLIRHGVVGERVSGLRTMAGLASDPCVLPRHKDLELVRVASLALSPAGEEDGTGSYVIDRPRAEMPMLPKSGRHGNLPNHQKENDTCRKQGR